MENVFGDDFDTRMDKPGYQWDGFRLAKRLGGEKLGASVYVIPPGMRSFPYHYHHANEEMLIVLEGDLELRTPEGTRQVSRGDAAIFNVGPRGAHQLHNTSDTPVRVLLISTMLEPEIAQYPDSGNVGLFDRFSDPDAEPLIKYIDGSAERGYFAEDPHVD